MSRRARRSKSFVIGTLRVCDVCGSWPGVKVSVSNSRVKSNGIVAVPAVVPTHTLTSLVLRFDTLTVTLTEAFGPLPDRPVPAGERHDGQRDVDRRPGH